MTKTSERAPAETRSSPSASRRSAVVTWYSVAKGYGFARLAGDDRDIFLHHSEIADGLALSEGEEIRLELGEGERGLFGTKVERLSAATTARPA